MVVNLAATADPKKVQQQLVALGLSVERLDSDRGSSFLIKSPSASVSAALVRAIDGVVDVASAAPAHPLLDQHPAVVEVAQIAVGGPTPVLMAGPCAVESLDQIEAIAARVAALGVRFLRGGAYKPRTSPYSFQGAGAEALAWLRRSADKHDLRVVTECLSPETAQPVAASADLIQIGSRNMHNYDLLRAVAVTGKPVLLKRGMAATIDEWLLSAEYCLLHGAPGVIFCERGVRSFDPSTRALLDLGAAALLANVMNLPVIVDPSHATGRRDLIPSLSRAALAVGVAGLMLETHDDPGTARSDGTQALPPDEFELLVCSLPTSR